MRARLVQLYVRAQDHGLPIAFFNDSLLTINVRVVVQHEPEFSPRQQLIEITENEYNVSSFILAHDADNDNLLPGEIVQNIYYSLIGIFFGFQIFHDNIFIQTGII